MKYTTSIAALLLGSSMLFGGTYGVDVDHSHLEFKVKHLMISNVKGQFTKFEGSFAYDEEKNLLTALEGVVDVNSIDTQNAKRDGHLKSADFFDAAKYPNMQLSLVKVTGDTVVANLTIHGVTKEVKMELESSGAAVKDPWGNIRRGLSLYTTINRADFGLTWNQLIESGGVMVGDKVKISIELEGILQKK
ncbi:MAG: YceI family protein [Campylobacterales bacterium]|nr:YceI family protein [Campylobacterales bacterium]